MKKVHLFSWMEVSIHVPLAEHDLNPMCRLPQSCRFNSRAPRGARLASISGTVVMLEFQFTCPSRSTTAHAVAESMLTGVSIHVPLAEHDEQRLDISSITGVSIHVPLAEHDAIASYHVAEVPSFNSRAPRGARREGMVFRLSACRFNSRAPRGARLPGDHRAGGVPDVSIHVPLAEHDGCVSNLKKIKSSFNSRAPRGARHTNVVSHGSQ